MNRSTKIIILAVLGLIAIGLISFFIFWPLIKSSNSPSAANVNAKGNSNAALGVGNENINANGEANAPPLSAVVLPETKRLTAARTIAKTFAERVATYSNQNNFANLDDLGLISTPAVYKYLQGDYKKSLLKALPVGSGYYAVTATATKITLAPIKDGQLGGSVQLQEVQEGLVSKTAYAVLDVKLNQVGDSWVVSYLEWEK